MKSFNVIWYNINKDKFEPYDVMPYLISEYKDSKSKLKTFKEFKDFVEKKSMYMYWSRCEYEIILQDWPCQKTEEKWDIYQQIMMNIDVVTQILMDNVNEKP